MKRKNEFHKSRRWKVGSIGFKVVEEVGSRQFGSKYIKVTKRAGTRLGPITDNDLAVSAKATTGIEKPRKCIRI
jgi:hypothetical protein